jgi:hypothetical protein
MQVVASWVGDLDAAMPTDEIGPPVAAWLVLLSTLGLMLLPAVIGLSVLMGILT